MSRPTLVSLLLLLLVALTTTTLRGASAVATRTLLSGGDLPHPVYLSFADEDAFVRRLSPPPKLKDAPTPAGAAYTLTSAYWDVALRNSHADRPPVDERATYYPAGGYVRARQAGSDLWTVLDLRQRAILDRYIRLGRQGLLPSDPSALELLVTTSKSEPVTVEIGGRALTDAETVAFWNIAASDRLSVSLRQRQSIDELRRDPDSVWIIFGLTEGRSVQFQYLVSRDMLIDGTYSEFYEVAPDWLRPVLGADAPRPGQTSPLRGLEVEQQPGRGAPLWWLVMLGAGFFCLAAALLLRRRAPQ